MPLAVDKYIDPVVERFVREAIKPLKGEIYRAYLFGSRARQDYRPDSDYDILIVLYERRREIVDRLYDVVMDILLDTGRLVSLKIFPYEEFRRLSSIPTPFIQNVLKEGIVIG